MRKPLKKTLNLLSFFGINLIRLYYSLRGLPSFFRDLYLLKKQKSGNRDFVIKPSMPILFDKYDTAGNMTGHYFHQDLYVAKKIFLANPERHIDIGSRIDGFVAHVAAFRKIEIFDVREVKSTTDNIKFKRADLMKLPEELKSCTDSLSALHSIEHFGLGRYGDPIDYFGHTKAIQNLISILRGGGVLYYSSPIGKNRIEFNAHRVFDVKYLLNQFGEKLQLKSFSYVDDKGDLHEHVEMNESEIEANFGCNYGCGIFELVKVS